MNVLMLYPKFPEETFWNTARSVKPLWRRKAIMPPLGLLTIASYLPEDFSVRLIDRNVDDLYADRKTHAEQGARNRTLWDRAAALGVQEAVSAIFNERFHVRQGY